MNLKFAKNLIVITVGIIMASCATCLMVKADVGLGSLDSMFLSVSNKTGVKMGTITASVYGIAVITQMILLGKKFKIRQLLQIPITFIMGIVINWGISLLKDIEITQYWIRMGMFLFATLLANFFVGAILALGLVHLPIEGACLALAEKKKWNFGVVRWTLDIFAIITSLSIWHFLDGGLFIREGTVINMLISAPLLNYFYNFFKKSQFIQDIMIKDKEEIEYQEKIKHNTHI